LEKVTDGRLGSAPVQSKLKMWIPMMHKEPTEHSTVSRFGRNEGASATRSSKNKKKLNFDNDDDFDDK